MIKKMNQKNRCGFTLVEMLMVVAIIGLLATLSVPGYLRHTRKARASEAVATMTMIRQSLRDYYIVNNAYYDIASPNIASQPATGAGVDVGIAQYFSNAAFSVDGTSPVSARFTSPGPQDFIISVDGSASVACGSSNCALDNTAVSTFRLEMDNTARVFISYDGGTNWTGK